MGMRWVFFRGIGIHRLKVEVSEKTGSSILGYVDTCKYVYIYICKKVLLPENPDVAETSSGIAALF